MPTTNTMKLSYYFLCKHVVFSALFKHNVIKTSFNVVFLGFCFIVIIVVCSLRRGWFTQTDRRADLQTRRQTGGQIYERHMFTD